MPLILSKFRPPLRGVSAFLRKTIWRHSPFRDQDPTKDGLVLWRERILFSVLAAGNGLSILALIPSVIMAFSEGLWLLATIDICAALASACLLMIGRGNLRMKTAGALLITFLIGIAVITQAGFLSGGPAWLFCFAVLSGVLLGLRAALIAILLNATALSLFWWLSSQGIVSSPPESFGTSRAMTAWVNFLFLNSVSAVSVAVLVNGLQSLNQKTIAATNALKEEREDLLQTRKKLKKEIVVRVNSEAALHQSEQKYRLLAENIQDVIWMMDMNFAFTYVSPSIDRLQGWSPDEYLALPLNQIMAPASLNKVLDEFSLQVDLGQKSGLYARACTLELELLRKNGSRVWAEVTASFLLGEGGYPIGMLGVSRDITERRRADLEKQTLLESLARSKKMEALGTLAGGVAHDLNNVLSGVVSYPDLMLLDLPDDSPLRRPIEVIRESGKRAAAIVQDLLTLARRGVHAEEIVNLNDLIGEYLVSPEYQRLKSFHPLIEVELRLEAELLNVEGSSIHLSKTLMNLISNAAEAMPSGGRIVIVTENRCLCPLQGKEMREGDYAILQVSDSGMGIPAEDLQRVFEPFFTKKKMGRSGTGLGMAVVWGTVQDHNGHIDIQSAEGRGTQVTVLLPATRKELFAPMPQNPLDAYRGTGETVLVVDDMAEQREIAAKIIEQLGYIVKSAESGERALELLKHGRADLLILDMIMDPGIDGLETYHRVKKLHPHQKAIITSGYAETERVRMAQRFGVGGYLKKPYTVYNLASAIKAELNRNGA
jgi:two-component system, cell cycle sensor histidine kinase and response regulator CckA